MSSADAQEVLDELHNNDRVATLAEYLAGGDVDLQLRDVLRPLGLADGDLCVEVDHDDKREFIKLAEDWNGFVSTTVKRDGTQWGPIDLSNDDLERRLAKPIDVRLVSNTPLTPEGEQ